MAPRPLPELSVLRLLLDLDLETGALRWRERPQGMFKTKRAEAAFNGRFAGALTFIHLGTKGYYSGRFLGASYFAHRVVWAMANDRQPSGFIDHINGNRTDNRPANLREATLSQNGFNSAVPCTNTSGFKGVSQVRSSGRWYAKIELDGKQISLGFFETAAEAAKAYDNAARAARGDFARTNGFH